MTLNSVKPLDLIIDNMNGYIEKSNGNKYLTLVTTDESKDILKKYGEKLKILLAQRIITQIVMMKNIWKSDSIQMMIHLENFNIVWCNIVVISVFNDGKKYCPHVFVDDLLYKLPG